MSNRKPLLPFIVGLFLTICLTTPLLFANPQSAHAYSVTGQKMNTQLWFRASQVFADYSREQMRLAMVTWNSHIPEYRRVCYNSSTHSLPNIYPQYDLECSIFKMGATSSGYLANTTWWYNNATGYTYEADININADVPWWYGVGDYYDLKSVMTHEVGHVVGLGHSGYSTAVMYSSFSTYEVRDSLTTDDLNGLSAVY